MHTRALVSASLLAMGAIGLAQAGDDRGGFVHEDKPENLKALFETIHRAVHVEKDAKRAAALFQALVPEDARAKKALRDGLPPETLRKITDQHKKMRIREEDAARLAKPEQTVVQVHGATTEEIAKYQEGSVAFKEFPGGAKRVAENLLRPGMTFYEVEFLAPGKDAGMKYHLFYWDGRQWAMLGPLWRLFPAEPAPSTKSKPSAAQSPSKSP